MFSLPVQIFYAYVPSVLAWRFNFLLAFVGLGAFVVWCCWLSCCEILFESHDDDWSICKSSNQLVQRVSEVGWRHLETMLALELISLIGLDADDLQKARTLLGKVFETDTTMCCDEISGFL